MLRHGVFAQRYPSMRPILFLLCNPFKSLDCVWIYVCRNYLNDNYTIHADSGAISGYLLRFALEYFSCSTFIANEYHEFCSIGTFQAILIRGWGMTSEIFSCSAENQKFKTIWSVTAMKKSKQTLQMFDHKGRKISIWSKSPLNISG